MVGRDKKYRKKQDTDIRMGIETKKPFDFDNWKPKTALGKQVKAKEIKDIDYILNNGLNIMEAEIVDALLPNLEHDLLLFGQSKGKFGGGKRSIWRQTQKKTKEGNRPSFAAMALVGDKEGHIGLGFGKAKETVPAREKAIRNAKVNLIKVVKGCGSWECGCKLPHSVPYRVEGKCGSVEVALIPAPKGTGLCIEKELKKILTHAGIKDIYSQTFGQTTTKINFIYACFDALKNLSKMKLRAGQKTKLGIEEKEI